MILAIIQSLKNTIVNYQFNSIKKELYSLLFVILPQKCSKHLEIPNNLSGCAVLKIKRLLIRSILFLLTTLRSNTKCRHNQKRQLPAI